MNYFKEILNYGRPYKKWAALNIICNILYALFSALSFAALIPMLDVLFDKSKKIYKEPVYTDLGHLKDYLQEYINFRVTAYSGNDEMKSLVLVIGLVLFLFLFKLYCCDSSQIDNFFKRCQKIHL